MVSKCLKVRVYGIHSETHCLSSVKMRVYGKPPETYAYRHPKTPNFDFKMRVYGK